LTARRGDRATASGTGARSQCDGANSGAAPTGDASRQLLMAGRPQGRGTGRAKPAWGRLRGLPQASDPRRRGDRGRSSHLAFPLRIRNKEATPIALSMAEVAAPTCSYIHSAYKLGRQSQWRPDRTVELISDFSAAESRGHFSCSTRVRNCAIKKFVRIKCEVS